MHFTLQESRPNFSTALAQFNLQIATNHNIRLFNLATELYSKIFWYTPSCSVNR